jgi:hypothetical protein
MRPLDNWRYRLWPPLRQPFEVAVNHMYIEDAHTENHRPAAIVITATSPLF